MGHRDRTARQRAGIVSRNSVETTDDPRIHVSLSHLLSLEGSARSLSFLPRQPAQSVLNGRHASKLRGRGLNFEELRNYLPGDDVRAIDWKVTARTGEPYVRVMTEERDRPALIVVDQRMSMYFGSRLNMKSVTAAEAAALAAFRILDQGDRLGGIVFSDGMVAEIRPQRSRAALHRLFSAIAGANQNLQADAEVIQPVPISQMLRHVTRIAPRNHLILVLSDFDGIDERVGHLVSDIARRNDLLLLPVSDPIAHEIPDGMQVVVTDGAFQAEIDTKGRATRQSLSDMAIRRLDEVFGWQRRYGIPVLPLSAGEETLPQLRRLMGLAG